MALAPPSGPTLAGYHGFFAACAQTVVFARLEMSKLEAIGRPLHEGASGWTLRIAESLEGPASLLLKAVGIYPLAAAAFLLGALLSRFGWMSAGTRSASDPESVFASQTD